MKAKEQKTNPTKPVATPEQDEGEAELERLIDHKKAENEAFKKILKSLNNPKKKNSKKS